MGKIMNLNPEIHAGETETSSDSAFTAASRLGRVVTGEEAERLYALFTRPARKPTPAMLKAIENYKRLKAAQCSAE